MNRDLEHFDRIEELGLELRKVESAGVFGRTMVDGRQLLRSQAGRGKFVASLHHLRWLSVAACLGLAVGVGSLIHRVIPSDPTDVSAVGDNVAVMDTYNPGDFRSCFDGPSSSLTNECSFYDQDSDGDVDLADYTRFQLLAGR